MKIEPDPVPELRRGSRSRNAANADEAGVREFVDAFTEAMRAKNVEAMLDHCAPDIATFDVAPPLKHKGEVAIRRLWTASLADYEAPIEYDVHRLEIVVDANVAFTRSLDRFRGTTREGERVINWLCVTLGLRRVENRWKLVHQHVSMPLHIETAHGMLDFE